MVGPTTARAAASDFSDDAVVAGAAEFGRFRPDPRATRGADAEARAWADARDGKAGAGVWCAAGIRGSCAWSRGGTCGHDGRPGVAAQGAASARRARRRRGWEATTGARVQEGRGLGECAHGVGRRASAALLGGRRGFAARQGCRGGGPGAMVASAWAAAAAGDGGFGALSADLTLANASSLCRMRCCSGSSRKGFGG
ncbi:alanine and glycine-rich protein [Triticum aestivum]|uniref:alanine and glycine-rich protein n=1 Tax=Triticum aestivum TaxID=4565 RepID=UPI001D003DD5|nr:alanine and glycine-rich protein-like [Triticum aestivum]